MEGDVVTTGRRTDGQLCGLVESPGSLPLSLSLSLIDPHVHSCPSAPTDICSIQRRMDVDGSAKAEIDTQTNANVCVVLTAVNVAPDTRHRIANRIEVTH